MIDSYLIERIKEGDRVSFGKVMDICLSPLLLLAIKLVGRKEDAEDIVQESFLKIWEKRGTIRDSESFIPWARKIVVNRCYDHLRSRARKNRVDNVINIEAEINILSSETADRPLKEKEAIRMLEFIGSRLSIKQGIVFVLSEIEGMSSSEISRLTGLTAVSIKSNGYHAREKVKKIFEKMEREENEQI